MNKIPLKLILIGDSNVGKTSLITRYIDKRVLPNVTIVPDTLTKEIVVDCKIIELSIKDTAGNERYASLNRTFYQYAECCILVFDVTNEESFKSLSAWKKEFELSSRLLMDLESLPFVVFGNKIDLSNQRIITIEMAQLWCKQNGNLQYFDVSAKGNTNLNNSFLAAIKISLNQYKLTHDENGIPLKLHNDDINNKPYSCCYY